MNRSMRGNQIPKREEKKHNQIATTQCVNPIMNVFECFEIKEEVPHQALTHFEIKKKKTKTVIVQLLEKSYFFLNWFQTIHSQYRIHQFKRSEKNKIEINN